MAEHSWPFDAGTGANITEGQWWQMAQMWAPDGVLSGSGGGLGVGELEVFADSSGMQVKVRPGQAWIKGQYYDLDAQATLGPFTAADATNDRIDRVVVTIDWTTNTGALTVRNGTAGASPIPPTPALTPGNVYDLLLAQVRIRAGTTTIAAGDVTDERLWTDLTTQLPAGLLMDYGGTSAPPRGWLFCYGQAVSRVTYARLFTAIGTNYGTGNGTTTFNLPDFRGRVAVPLDTLGGVAASRVPTATSINSNGGAVSVTLTVDQIPSHVHTATLTGTSGTESATHTHGTGTYAAATGTASAGHTHDAGSIVAAIAGESAHTHNVGTLANTADTTHAHGAGTLAADAETAHTHGAGSFSNAGEGTHAHGVGTIAGSIASSGQHAHPVLFKTVSFQTGASGLPSVGTVGVNDGATTGAATATSSSDHAHTISMSGASAAGSSHTHVFSGTSAAGSSHGHTLSGASAAGSSHTHPITGASAAGASHTHTATVTGTSAGQSADHTHATTLSGASAIQTGNHQHSVTVTGTTGGTGTNQAHENMPPWLCVTKVIKY